MKNFIQQKGATAVIVIATIILAGVSIFTAVRLYQIRDESVSPVAPESQPDAKGVRPTPTDNNTASCSLLTFKLTTQTPTPTEMITSTPTPTLIITLTPTPTKTITSTPTPTNKLTSTPTPTNSTSNSPTPTDISVGGTSSTPMPTQAELPPAGIGMPTIVGSLIGGMLLMFALAFAL